MRRAPRAGRRSRWSRAVRERVRELLRRGRRRGDVAMLARIFNVSERTIRNWARGEDGRIGRPPRAPHERRRAFTRVARVWRLLGRTSGWRTVGGALGSDVPTRLVQESLRRAKRLWRRHARRRRVHVAVLARDALWHLDATHLGRTRQGEVQAQVLRDAASPQALAASTGGPVSAQDAVHVVDTAIAVNGRPPLVLATDNGPPYVAAGFEAYLAGHRIVHLKNLPRTPQHNARAERTIRAVKAESGLGAGARLASPRDADEAIAVACARLALRVTQREAASCAYTEKQRERFYDAVCRRGKRAVRTAHGARARRMAEREAVNAELEERGLIQRTRGGARSARSKAEINS